MKVDYKGILESYERANQELLELCYEPALEADSNTLNTTNAVSKEINNSPTDVTTKTTQLEPGSKQKTNIIQRIKKIIDKVVEFVRTAFTKIINRLRLLVESDKGFYKNLHEKMAMQKPLQNFKAITYNYDEKYLESTMKGIKDLTFGAITALANPMATVSNSKIKQIIECDNSTIVANLLSNYTKDKSREGGHDVQSFTREMIDTYRGEKKERMWNASQIQSLISLSKRSNELGSECQQLENKFKTTINEMKRMESKARQLNTTEELNKLTQATMKASSLYNAFLGITRVYFELRLESALSARYLLKKFYTF